MAMLDINFDPDAHRYTVGGNEVPHVTGILKPLEDFSHVNAQVLKAAAEFGQHVHECCHLFDVGALDEAALDHKLAPYLAGWKQFLEETGAVVLESEVLVASSKYRYAGTLDKVLFWKNRRSLVDLKATAQIPKVTVGVQTSAYAQAYLETYGRSMMGGRYCVQLEADGYQLQPCKNTMDFDVFLSALNIYNWRVSNGT